MLDLETGRGVRVSMGRPNLDHLITGIVAGDLQDRNVGVIASGETALSFTLVMVVQAVTSALDP